ncbi:MAG TPA: HAMP domain-containing protein, partial [Helicobacteraceae bacterium]|nr:HAMP domain-containing protein [Helicobacteraceae bacterium]
MLIVIAVLTLYTTINFAYRFSANKTTLAYETKFLANLVAKYTITPLVFQDKQGAQEALQQLENVKFIDQAILYDNDATLFASYTNTLNLQDQKELEASYLPQGYYQDQLYIKVPVIYKGQHYGDLLLVASTKTMYLKLTDELLDIFFVMLLVIMIAYFIVSRTEAFITKPITKLAKLAQSITKTQDYSLRARKIYNDEVGTLYDEFNVMLTTLQKSGYERDEAEAVSQQHQRHLEQLTEELEQRVQARTKELEDSILLIKETQAQLLEAEKMSALGNLVAGVAHEVNTPLGISITASSIFNNEIKEISQLLKDNALTQSRLTTFLQTFEEASTLLTLNLNRAAELVKNFKQIAVDQSSESLREFELHEYLEEVCSTFTSEFKRHHVTLHLHQNKDTILMHSLPGFFSQVFVNLIQNSLMHAFKDTPHPTISITPVLDGDDVKIIYEDNGAGVAQSVHNNLFEPFVTTKRNEGGTGLGLNITYNLIHQKLKGSIVLDADFHNGARFIVRLKRHISLNFT